MLWILVGIGGAIFLLILLGRFDPSNVDQEAAEEAHNASKEELEHVLHPPPKTAHQLEEEKELFEDK